MGVQRAQEHPRPVRAGDQRGGAGQGSSQGRQPEAVGVMQRHRARQHSARSQVQRGAVVLRLGHQGADQTQRHLGASARAGGQLSAGGATGRCLAGRLADDQPPARNYVADSGQQRPVERRGQVRRRGQSLGSLALPFAQLSRQRNHHRVQSEHREHIRGERGGWPGHCPDPTARSDPGPAVGVEAGFDELDKGLGGGVPRVLSEEHGPRGSRGRLPQQLERREAAAAAHRDSGTSASASRTMSITRSRSSKLCAVLRNQGSIGLGWKYTPFL